MPLIRYDLLEEWRTTVVGWGWHNVLGDDGERWAYSGPCRADALAVAEWERRRKEREAMT